MNQKLIEELAVKMQEFLETLDDEDKDERYATKREFAAGALEKFYNFINKQLASGQQLKPITQILSKQQEQQMHTVTYIRKSQKAVDHPDGFVFLHRWPTGYQELVFQTLEDAAKFCDSCNQEKEIDDGI